MGSRLRRMLSETLARRKDPAEERVFTSPATGRPMERAQLTAAARTALLRGGLEGVSLRDLCAEGRRADQSRMLAEQAAAQGWLERGDVMRLLGVSRTAARQQLLRLREAGVLVRVGERYYPAGAVTPPEEQLAVIQTYLREHGSGRRQDFLRLLNVSPAQGSPCCPIITLSAVSSPALWVTGNTAQRAGQRIKRSDRPMPMCHSRSESGETVKLSPRSRGWCWAAKVRRMR